MRTFSQWVQERGFWVRETFDEKKGKFVGVGRLVLFPIQKLILDFALQIDPETDKFRFETVVYSCIKKSGKSALAAAVGAWYAEEVGPAGTEIYVIANDQEQAEGRVMRDIKFHYEMKIARGETYFNDTTGVEEVLTQKNCKITLYRIDLPNGTFIQANAQSYRTVAGSRHSLTLWDELWGVVSELSRRVYEEMTPIATVSRSLRFIATYAGFENESDLLWDLYLQGVGPEEHEKGQGTRIPELGELPCYSNRRLFCYWDHEARLPWQTEEYFDEQMRTLRPAAFLRLHLNQWVTSQEAFVPVEWWDKAAKSYEADALLWGDHPMRSFPVFVAADAGIKHDSTALVGVAYDAKRAKVGELFRFIWTPQKGDPVDLDATVEATVLELRKHFNIVRIVYDPSQLLQTMLRLRQRGIMTEEFTQSVTQMTAASQLLYDLLKNNNLETFPGDEARKHIQMAVAETTSRGFRIVKSKIHRQHYIDYSIALAMASYAAVSSGGIDVSTPLVVESPYSDASAWGPQEEQYLPPELREDTE